MNHTIIYIGEHPEVRESEVSLCACRERCLYVTCALRARVVRIRMRRSVNGARTLKCVRARSVCVHVEGKVSACEHCVPVLFVSECGNA